jgi:hypothetical protein
MTYTTDPAPTAHVLARDVTSALFRSDGVAISMVVNIQVGENKVTLSSSAMPRRTVVYR